MRLYRYNDCLILSEHSIKNLEKHRIFPEPDDDFGDVQALYYAVRTGTHSKVLTRFVDDSDGMEDKETLGYLVDHKRGRSIVSELEAYLPVHLIQALRSLKAFFINVDSPRWMESIGKAPLSRPAKVHIMGLGDVGSTLAMGLLLQGEKSIEEIGLYDLDEQRVQRWVIELGQIARGSGDQFPRVKALKREELMACDVFAFTATAGIPPLSVTTGDVRIVQYEGNSRIVDEYARMARDQGFKGLFAVVSDPVDLLSRRAYDTSNRNENGTFDNLGLLPEQVMGFGLGVMYGRARYFAREFGVGFEYGRAYGPHGKGLVIANDSLRGKYDPKLSEKLTKATVEANLQIRALGYKPYIAPALASGALSILDAIEGQWHYSCVSIGGVYFGCRNRLTPYGLEVERQMMDPKLVRRVASAYEELENQWRFLQSSALV